MPLDIRDNTRIEKKLIQMLQIGTAQIKFFADFINSPTILRHKTNFIAQIIKGFVVGMLVFGVLCACLIASSVAITSLLDLIVRLLDLGGMFL